MFVPESTLEVLVPFFIVGFLFSMYVAFKYSYRFGYWATGKVLDKFFTKRNSK